MASEQSKSPAEHPPPPQAAPVMAYPPPYGAGHYPPMPPGAYGQPIYTLAPMPADPNHDPNGANGAPPPGPYLMAFPPPPPGLVYAYAPPPPHGQRARTTKHCHV
jgi:neural Wiskott-Aldrich syndrome protein